MESVEKGRVEVIVRKCHYTIKFEDVPMDFSEELDGLADDTEDKGYSNRAVRDVEIVSNRLKIDRDSLASQGEVQFIDIFR